MADINIILDAAPVQAVNGKIGFVTLSPQDIGITGLATSGDLLNYVTKVNGEFDDRPFVNGTGVLLEGDLDLSVYATVTNLATTGSALQSSVDTLTTDLATTGSTLQSGVDTLTTDLATTGSTLASNLATTGSNLQSQITGKANLVHTHVAADVTNLGTAATRNVGTASDEVSPGNHTHIASNITDSTNAGRTLLTSNLAAQRSHLDFFPTFPSQSFFPANGDVNRVYTALDTAKIYAWISLLNDYVEISPTQSGELDTRYALITNLATTGSTLQGQINNRVTNLGGASGMQVLTTGEYNSLTPISGVVYILI